MAQSDDAATPGATATAIVDAFPTHKVGKPEVREMPAEPKQFWRLIGPGIIAAGVGLASGEFILYRYIFEPTQENMGRWRGWWKFANIEQLSTFVLIPFLTILFTSLLAYATVFGREGLPNSIAFIQTEGQVLGERVGSWFQYLFWAIGAFSLFAAAMGIVDYTSRLAADVIKTSYAHNANESKVYAGLVWGLVLIGIIVLLIGVDQPILLLVISAVTGGFMMFMYSGLLILINRKLLPGPIKIRGVRVAVLIWSILLFGTLSVLTFRAQLERLFGG
jgi:uncharacterized membrane-anchored protein